jgi:hypothetical protein
VWEHTTTLAIHTSSTHTTEAGIAVEISSLYTDSNLPEETIIEEYLVVAAL